MMKNSSNIFEMFQNRSKEKSFKILQKLGKNDVKTTEKVF